MKIPNIITVNGVTHIFEGGDPLKDCPKDWDWANEWEEKANKGKEEYSHVCWNWDCGFKLDFDGPLIRISSRFYPPKSHYGEKWDGSIDVMIGDKTIHEKKIECETLEELKITAERYIKKLSNIIENFITGVLKEDEE